MSTVVQIDSAEQFNSLLSSSTVVVADCKLFCYPPTPLRGLYPVFPFISVPTNANRVTHSVWADWCGPCKAIAPLYEQLSSQLSRPNKITFTKINADQQKQLAGAYGVSALPTFMTFKNGRATQTIRGADTQKLSEAIKKLANEANALGDASASGESSGETSNMWLGAGLPKGYKDVTDQVDIKDLELLNWDSDFGGVRTLFDAAKPSGLDAKGKSGGGKKDWVESDTDEQLMLFIPLQSTLKVHSLHITSLPPREGEDDVPMRPKTVKIYSNRVHVLDFGEAEDTQPTQEIVLGERDWDQETGTARIELRFVKFQNVSSLVVFVVDGDGEGERVRVDRIRVVGETLQKRDPGKLEKVGEDD
ncbi:MAG: hypothetical protein Q9227_000744 [Pyrenula ochraceoflavens]